MKINSYFSGVVSEFKKVSWPKRNEALVSIGLVIFASTIAALFFFGVDSLVYRLINFILS